MIEYFKKSITLIELVVVVVIIGILAVAAIPKFNIAVEEARRKKARTMLKSIRGAEKIYNAINDSYVSVGIDDSRAVKDAAWDLLTIEVDDDTPEWKYGVINCGVCPNAYIPYVRRAGVTTSYYLYTTMSTGVAGGPIDATASGFCTDAGVGAPCSGWE